MILLLFLSFFLVCFGQDNGVNKNYNMPLAAAAYSDDPSQCLSNVAKYWSAKTNGNRTITIHQKYSLNCKSLNDTCAGYLAIDFDNSDPSDVPAIYVVLKGTTNFEQFYGTNWKYDEMVGFGRNGFVSKQILDAFHTIWINAGMKNEVLALKNRYPGSYFTFIGHSTGGAMASLAAATTVLTEIIPVNNVALITFGEPRTGDKDYANEFNALINTFYANRIIHNADIVPHLPSLNGTKYYHHAEEVWYPNNMGPNDTYIDCGQFDGEAQNCSNSLDQTKLTFDEHKNYFGRDFISYGRNGCADLTFSKQKTDERIKVFAKRILKH